MLGYMTILQIKQIPLYGSPTGKRDHGGDHSVYIERLNPQNGDEEGPARGGQQLSRPGWAEPVPPVLGGTGSAHPGRDSFAHSLATSVLCHDQFDLFLEHRFDMRVMEMSHHRKSTSSTSPTVLPPSPFAVSSITSPLVWIRHESHGDEPPSLPVRSYPSHFSTTTLSRI
ncbi:hypothetical protein Fmac_015863 [Flemingia macrophylla]|uniref:Uncharacterized protein n=1 Tax=Flemingia macrophylla TaxID=520843 RepID=A0ABD1MFR7_9FABA